MSEFSGESIQAVRERLLAGMACYMRGTDDQAGSDWDCGYSQAHIDRCATIVDEYLAAVAPNQNLPECQIRTEVKNIVAKLNSLNDECAGALIETDQREDLCMLILTAATEAGLTTTEDITEEWREW